MHKVPVSPYSHQHLLFSFFKKNYSHPTKYEVVFHYGFDLHFLMINIIDHLFMCLFVICITSLDKCLKWVVFLLLSCSSLYILDNKPNLSDTICKYFLPFCGLRGFHFIFSKEIPKHIMAKQEVEFIFQTDIAKLPPERLDQFYCPSIRDGEFSPTPPNVGYKRSKFCEDILCEK